ncbi:hypothetical protein EDD18DRAFT_1114666 [Armillaria luteobubalina]|uniref:CxC2-like cysteine cluster KDZ transposase-associated domain-containing protein n=1 Tax=Armillaria luteobubalina TaxID=153913 RepID=A0AA39P4V5_9AGAR|nr:hypothetical protein EDD18DRAFT_1114666 [Armillaria luteobubalina]
MAVDRVFNSVPYDEFILPPEVWQDEIILHSSELLSVMQSHFCRSAVARQMQVISGTIAKVDINYTTACYVLKTTLHYRAVSMSAQWEGRACQCETADSNTCKAGNLVWHDDSSATTCRDFYFERNYGSQTKKTALDGEAANLTDQLLQQVRPRRKKRTIDVGVRFLQKQLIADMSFRMNHFIDGSEKLTAILWSSCASKHGLVQRYAGAEWNGTFYSQITLQDMGLKVQLGHLSGETCPYPRASGRSVVVIDVEGIHKINMLRARWFPATVEFPHTAVTFAVLRHFQMMSFMSKVSSYEYYQSLARLHDNTGSLMLPVVGPVSGVFARGLRMVTHPNAQAAWSRSGVNLSGNRKKEDIWLDRLFVSVDANFRLKRFNVSSDRRDPRLNKGYSYFIDSEIVNVHMKKFEDKIVEEKSTCNDHDTVKLATMCGGKGMSVSGVGAVVCSRHECQRGSSVINLRKGEQQVRMDLPTLLTLKTEAPKEVVIAYDIGCQWGKNLWKRINVYGPDLTPPQKQKDIVILVPKFHLPAHIVECQEEFSFAFELFVGETDGEATERTWAISNPVASSMREMGLGSRQDTLDDHWSDHNWRKNAGLLVSSAEDGKVRLQEWTEWVESWERRRSSGEKVKNPYVPTVKPLTMASVRLQLSEEGLDAQWGASTGTLISANKMIADGLLAEQAQLDLQKEMKALGPHSTDIQRVKVLDKTSRLRQKIDSWMEVQLVYMPEVRPIRGEEDRAAGGECVVAWNIDLLLPLSLLMKHNILCDKRLLHYEWELCCAQATEALGIVRRKVILETYVVNHKGVYGHGQKIGTASNNLLDVCRMEKTWSMATYNRAHEALRRLAGPLGMTDWYKTYRVLRIEDAVPIAGLKQRKKRDTSSKETSGESTVPQLSWIWLIAGAVDNSTPEGLQDALRIEWCKLQARMQRWDEECCLLHEEMQRVLRSHEYNIKLWSNRAERSIKGAAHGARAYAFRQAFVRQQMKAYCERTWSSVEEWLKIDQIHENEGDVDDADLLGEESESHVTAILGSERN